MAREATKVGSRVSVFCDGLLEAGWLAAAVAIPLLFNLRSAKIFEVDKVALLRSLALLMVMAWVVREIERRREPADAGSWGRVGPEIMAFVSRPLVVPAMALLIVHLVATAVSVWPHGSQWGSYDRRQGVYTTFAYLMVFFMVVHALRERRQAGRLISFSVAASIPVSLYAIAQRAGIDPVTWSGDVVERVSSTLGNPIFAAGYLIMVLPLALARAVRATGLATRQKERRAQSVLTASFYGTVVLLHLVAIVLTQSRGPAIGLLVGLFFFFLLWSVAEGRRRVAVGVVAVAVVASAFLVIVNLPRTPMSAVRDWPYLGRLTSIRAADSLASRSLMWEAGLKMAAASPLRGMVGYGPDTTRVAFYPYMSAQLAEMLGVTATTGRFHNEMMDALVETGILGLLAHLVLFGSVFIWSLKTLGVLPDARQTRRFAASLTLGGSLGLVAAWLLGGGPRWLALGLPAGILLAMAAYLVPAGLGRRAPATPSTSGQMLLIGIFAGLASHFAEIQTGIAVTATRSQFWLYAGLIAAVATGLKESPALDQIPLAPHLRTRRGRSATRGRRGAPLLQRRRLAEALVYSLGVGLLLITLAFGFIGGATDYDAAGFLFVAGLLAVAWATAGLITVLDTTPPGSADEDPRWQGNVILVYAGVSLGLVAAFVPIQLAVLNAPGTGAAVATLLYVFVVLSVAGIALALARITTSSVPPQHQPGRFWRQGVWWLYPLLTALMLFLVWQAGLRVVRADIVFAHAQAYRADGQLDRSIPLYRRAVELAPRQDHYWLFVGQAYLSKALASEHPSWFRRAEAAGQTARELAPLRPDHYANLGLIYQNWGRASQSPSDALEKLERALAYYERAANISPHTQGRLVQSYLLETHVELAQVYGAIGATDRAIDEAEAAHDLASGERRAEIQQMLESLRSQ